MTEIDQDGLRSFRALLHQYRYSYDGLQESLGLSRPPAPGEELAALGATATIDARNLLIRCFFLGLDVDEALAVEFIPESVLAFCLESGFLSKVSGKVVPCVVIVPVDSLLFVSDAFRILGTDVAGDFVLPARTHAADFLRHVTVRDAQENALDLGCGCGVHALLLAQHCQHVVATDISPKAIHYTRINAGLNGIDNVEILQGSLFDPVNGRRFDLIISNPPFVISPDQTFVYRDNPFELDNFSELLIKTAPTYLNDGGQCQLLSEWVELSDASWQDRLRSWVRGCHAFVLHAAPVLPDEYVRLRSGDLSGEDVDTGSADHWQRYLAERNVRSIHPGMLMLIKANGPHWMHVQDLYDVPTSSASDAVRDSISAVEFLELCDDDSLLQAVFEISDSIQVIPAQPESEDVVLALGDGLRTRLTVDPAVAAFLKCFESGQAVSDVLTQFEQIASSDEASGKAELLTIVRAFIARQFLLPADLN